MPYTTAGKHLMLNALRGTNPATPITHVSAHTGEPGDAGSNEVAGGSYARQEITFSAPSGGAIDSSTQPVIPIPASTTVTHLGFFSASTSGTCLAWANVDDETFTNAGEFRVADADLDLNA